MPNDTSQRGERNKAIVRALYEAYNRRDYEAAFAHKAEDYTIEVTGTSWVSGRFQGRDYVRHELLPRVFPEGVTFRLRNLVAEGDVVMRSGRTRPTAVAACTAAVRSKCSNSTATRSSACGPTSIRHRRWRSSGSNRPRRDRLYRRCA